MLPGFNHNIKYHDRVYHVQTEDSGSRAAHVTTLLFIGGNVIASSKTTYGHLREQPDLNNRVVEIMQAQHKTMLRALVSGRYDKEIAERSVNAATLEGPAPINVEAGAQHRASELVAPMSSRPAPSAAAKQTATVQTATPPSADAGDASSGRSADKPGAGKDKAGARGKKGIRKETHFETLAPFLTSPKHAGDAPAGKTPGASPRTAASEPAAVQARGPQAPEAPTDDGWTTGTTSPDLRIPVQQPPGPQRGAPPRAASQSTRDPGSAMSTARTLESEQLRNAFAKGDKAADDSIFGNLISPKPLDEVILSYLANNKSSDKK